MLLGLLLVPLLFSCKTSQPTDPWLDHLERHLDSLALDPGMGAVSMAAVSSGHTYLLHRGKLNDGQAPGDKHLYEIASLTKTFTGTLLAQAIVAGKVKLDDDIRFWLPGDFANLAYENHPITFRHLLTHQSGLPRMFPDQPELFENPDWNALPGKLNALQEGFSREDFMAALQKVELDTLPGTRFAYSNAGANLLGYMLEEMYQMPYAHALQKHILHPLGMTSTAVELDADLQARVVKGQNDQGIQMPLHAMKEMNAEGGIVSSTADMAQYLRFHLDTTQADIQVAHQELWGGKFGDYEAGFFWQIFKDGDRPDRIFQNGGAYGTSSWVTLIPEKQRAIFIVTNRAGPDLHQKLGEAVDKMLDD
ncbi:MAG: serine hydrolase domain-containing protein [Bacteroidota bacterium]